MAITLDLQPEVEKELPALAAARGLSLDDSVKEIVVREAQVGPARRTGQELIDASAKVRGLMTDEEVDTLFSRTASCSRLTDFE